MMLRTPILFFAAVLAAAAQNCLYSSDCMGCGTCHVAPYVGYACNCGCEDCFSFCPYELPIGPATPEQQKFLQAKMKGLQEKRQAELDRRALTNPHFLSKRGELAEFVYSKLVVRPMPDTAASRKAMGLPTGHPTLASMINGRGCKVGMQALLKR